MHLFGVAGWEEAYWSRWWRLRDGNEARRGCVGQSVTTCLACFLNRWKKPPGKSGFCSWLGLFIFTEGIRKFLLSLWVMGYEFDSFWPKRTVGLMQTYKKRGIKKKMEIQQNNVHSFNFFFSGNGECALLTMFLLTSLSRLVPAAVVGFSSGL